MWPGRTTSPSSPMPQPKTSPFPMSICKGALRSWPTAAAKPCAGLSAPAWCWATKPCSSRRGNSVRRITGRAATIKSARKRSWGCWRRWKPGCAATTTPNGKLGCPTSTTSPSGCATLTAYRPRSHDPTGLSNRAPVLTISWDPAVLHITGAEVAEDFARNTPRIAVASGGANGRTSIGITPNQMQPGNDQVVADRIHRILSAQRSPQSTELAPPATDVSGSWDLTINYSSSSSQHQLFLEQEGHWIGGTHISDFFPAAHRRCHRRRSGKAA